MRYEGKVYRPPSEADSVIIQSTVGCPHNQCNFCNMYKEKRFKIRSVEEIKEDLDKAKNNYGADARRLFLADGNIILIKTDQLVEVLEYAYEVFPKLERETKLLIQNLEGIKSQLLSDHISNYWDISGKFPRDKSEMIKEINHALEVDETEFRDPASGHL